MSKPAVRPPLSKRLLIIAAYVIPALIVIAAIITLICAAIVNNNHSYIISNPEEYPGRVALVPGGGIGRDNTPTDVVKSRLDAAAVLYFEGAVEKIIVSGDNRFTNYNEPLVMQTYLENRFDIPSSSIQQDNAGRSTYESCDRAKHIFQLDTLIVVSQRSHLPRAIFLCRSFGIKTYGFPTFTSHQRVSQSLRELAANTKAVFNVYVKGESTIYGDPIPL